MCCSSWSLFFLCFILLHSVTPTVAQQGPYVCSESGNYSSNSTYRVNLDSVLASMTSNTEIDYGFYNFSAGQNSDKVNAIALCRGDISTDECRRCVNATSHDLLQVCPNQKEAIIWNSKCSLRYSNRSILGVMEANPMIVVYNVQNDTDVKGFNELLTILIERLSDGAASGISSPRKFAMGNITAPYYHYVYALVECTPDLDELECRKCLEGIVSYIPQCCDGKRGGKYVTPSCDIRYETYVFTDPAAEAPQPSQFDVTDPPLPPTEATKGGNNTKKIVIITVSTIAVVAALLGFWFYLSFGKRKRREGETSEVILLESLEDRSAIHFMDRSMHARGPDSSGEVHYFNLNTMKIATNNFSDANKLGQGGFGPVYKGKLVDGKEVAVKRLSTKSKQGLEEFKNEVMFIVKLQHRNLVRLLGCCLEGGEKLLVYEYMANTSLDAFLFDPKKCRELDWAKRTNIVNGIARGILYLHEDSRLKIIHRDLKASNVLLDDDMNPKISDFGTARYFAATQIEANTNRVVGTYGYMAPEYALEGLFSIKSDVYSFGVLVLEIVSGKKNIGFYQPDRAESLIPHVWQLWNEGKAMELIDQNLAGSYPESEALRMIHIALLCVQEDPSDRPTMSLVVIMLGSQLINLPQPLAPPFSTGRYVTSDQSTSTGAGTGFATSDQSSTGASQ